MESNPNHASTLFNKILIPVITTVLGTAAIYFLGFNKRASGRTDMEQMLLSKDATVKAWKSFVTSQNIGYKMISSLSEEYGQKVTEASKQGLDKLPPVWKAFEEEVMRESKKSDQDIRDILKDGDIDRDFVSMLNRVLDNGKDQEEKASAFFDKMVSLAGSAIDPNEKLTKLNTELGAFVDKGKRDQERMLTEAEAIAKVLAERYNQAFNLNDLDSYVEAKKEKDKKPDEPKQPITNNDPNPPATNPGINQDPGLQNSNPLAPTVALLAGQWEMNGGMLELSQNGDLYWSLSNGMYTSGYWQLVNTTIRINATNPDTKKTMMMYGAISDFTRGSFTLTLQATPVEVYRFKKKVDY